MTSDPLELAFAHDEIAELDAAERRLALRALLLQEHPSEEPVATLAELADAIDGFGPLTRVMQDDAVTDVLVNGCGETWVEKHGVLALTDVAFSSEGDLRAWIDRVLAQAGARVDASKPMADARLKDGSRIHVALPPIAPGGPLVSIRRWPPAPMSLEDLVCRGMVTQTQAALLTRAVGDKQTIAISGGTGSGKTTLLNALLAEVPDDERVVVLEETAELRPRCAHHVSLLTRAANVEGVGTVELADLVRASLRMRPDRIVVGEVRGPEALAALAAMSVGHEGSLVTVHSRSAAAVVDRLVSLTLLTNSVGDPATVRDRVMDTFDLFVHMERDADGARKVTEIAHVETVRAQLQE